MQGSARAPYSFQRKARRTCRADRVRSGDELRRSNQFSACDYGVVSDRFTSRRDINHRRCCNWDSVNRGVPASLTECDPKPPLHLLEQRFPCGEECQRIVDHMRRFAASPRKRLHLCTLMTWPARRHAPSLSGWRRSPPPHCVDCVTFCGRGLKSHGRNPRSRTFESAVHGPASNRLTAKSPR